MGFVLLPGVRPSGHGRLLVGRFLGVPVYLHPSWWIVFVLLSWTLAKAFFAPREPELAPWAHWTQGVLASLLFFASILLHELGHALVALRHQIGIDSITLFIFGGVARMARDPEDARTELRIAAAGPLVSLGLAGVFGLASALPFVGATGHAVTAYLAVMNLGLALFNLVPAFPLDGGRILHGLLWPSMGKTRATALAATAGSFFAFLLIGIGVANLLGGIGLAGLWYVLIGWFLNDASAEARQRALIDEILRGVSVREAMLRDVVTLPAHVSVAEAAHEHVVHTGYGGYPVKRGGVVVGLLCLRDILRLPPEDRETTAVQAIMTPLSDAIVIAPDEPMLTALAKMAEAGTGRLLVMENGELVGLLTMNSIIRHARVRQELGS